jgi:hypothetical protein
MHSGGQTLRTFLLVAVLGTLTALTACRPKPATPVPAPPPAPSEEKCEAPAAWFAAGGTKPVPEDFRIADSCDECAFYKWGWQTFLWLTQSDQPDGSPRFLSFRTNNDLFDTAGGKLQLVASPAGVPGGKRVLSLSIRNSPTTSRNVSAAAIAQAGSQGVLVDQNNRAVYFAMHVNDRFVKFIREDLKVTKAEQLKDVPEDQPGFPPGCIEMKSAWRVLTEAERAPASLEQLRKTVFVTDALVPTLVEDKDAAGHPVIKAVPEKPRPELVALVGLHVVGTIVDHPEFIWASFEHVKNSPTPPKANLGGNEPVDATNDYTFYPKGALKKDCNRNPVDPTATTRLRLKDKDKQTLEPVVNVFREFNSGDDGVAPDDLVQSLNESVQTNLRKSGTLGLWSNYQLIGAVWFKKTAAFGPGKKYDNTVDKDEDILAGEKRLSNSTMETFTQKATAKPNCFRCHDTTPEVRPNGDEFPGLRINVSHIIRGAYRK